MTVFIIIGLYFAGLLLIGYLSSKKNKNSEDFFVAGRSLNKWTAANTMAATAIGSGTTIGVCTMAYEAGISAGWILAPSGARACFQLFSVTVKPLVSRYSRIRSLLWASSTSFNPSTLAVTSFVRSS